MGVHNTYATVTADEFTVAYDIYMHEQLDISGLLVCIEAKGDILQAIEIAPNGPELLAGLIKLDADPWSPAGAAATARHITSIADSTMKALFIEALIIGLNQFFQTRDVILNDFETIIARGVTGNITQRTPPETRGRTTYGQWDEALRVLAGYNPDILIKQLSWHLRDFLLAFEYTLKRESLQEYRHQTSVYAAVAPYAKKGTLKPPTIPRVLRGRKRHNG